MCSLSGFFGFFFAYKFSVWAVFTNEFLIKILCHEGFGKLVEGLCSGLVSAYFFYVFVDLRPRQKLIKEYKSTLDLLIVSVLDVYKKPGMFRHEAEIETKNIFLLDKSWLKSQINYLENCHQEQNQTSFYLQVKWTAERAERRLMDFRHVLAMATEISPDHTVRWLSITDKLNLFVETMHQRPDFSIDDMVPWGVDLQPGEINYLVYMKSLCFRLQEFFEVIVQWIELNDVDSKP